MNITLIFMLIFFIIAFLIAVIVFALAGKHKITENNKRYIRREWAKIFDSLKTNPESALINADKLLDHALKILGYSGSLGDKLKKHGSLFHDVNGVWEAHKFRNKLAHEIGFKITQEQAAKCISKYQRALKDLGVNFN